MTDTEQDQIEREQGTELALKVAEAMADLTEETRETLRTADRFLRDSMKELKTLQEQTTRTIEKIAEQAKMNLWQVRAQAERASRFLTLKTWLLAMATGAVINLGLIGYWIWRHPPEHEASGKKVYRVLQKMEETEGPLQ